MQVLVYADSTSRGSHFASCGLGLGQRSDRLQRREPLTLGLHRRRRRSLESFGQPRLVSLIDGALVGMGDRSPAVPEDARYAEA